MHAYFRSMNRWEALLEKVSCKLGRQATVDDILLLIGIRESCHPARANITPSEKENLVKMAEQTILVPGRYYQLIWVEDNGWPHYQPINRPPAMTEEERESFLRHWILEYAEKNGMFK